MKHSHSFLIYYMKIVIEYSNTFVFVWSSILLISLVGVSCYQYNPIIFFLLVSSAL